MKQSNAEIEKTIREIKEMQAEREKTREVRQHLDEFRQRLQETDEGPRAEEMRKLQPKRPVKPRQQPKKANILKKEDRNRPLAVGDNVLLKGSTTVGTVMSVDEKYALVAFGNLKTRVETKRLERTLRQPEKAKSQPTVSKATSDEIRSRQLSFNPDIDVRGMRGDEAVQAITYFIDDAIQFSAKRVRILHGTGTGILRSLIRQYLNTVPGVKSYHDEDVRLGGAGITVVDLE